MNSQKNYTKFHDLSKSACMLEGISHLLDWDQETYMPAEAAGIRSEQLKMLAGLAHKERTSKKYAKALAKLIDLETGTVIAKDLSPEQQAALHQWRRDFIHDTALPTKFVKEFAQLCSKALLAWSDAKQENAFHYFAPYLDKLISMNRKKADYLGYEAHPYDALLDLYEPNMRTAEIDQLFSKLEIAIVSLLKKISNATQLDDSFIHGNYNEEKQIALGTKILEAIGYDLQKGRLDTSTHPFSSSCHPTDSRITTRIIKENALSNVGIVLHEGGHGMYEMGLPVEHYGSPLCEAISMGIHESQSRWWETLIGQSEPFAEYLLPLLQEVYKGKFNPIDNQQLYRAINKVTPSLIRVEADEVTYPLHIILRFQLEKGLIEGTLKVRDIPEAWNHKMKELLGITPKNNSEGCLQDIHWSMGNIGYFPTYTLGNMYATQFFQAFNKEHPHWGKQVAGGDFGFIKKWLSHNVYRHGRRYRAKELTELISGKSFTAEPYIDYLQDKYSRLYHL